MSECHVVWGANIGYDDVVDSEHVNGMDRVKI